MTGPSRRMLGAAAVLLLAAGCASADGAASVAGPVALQVYAASSLQQPFEEIGDRFEAQHRGVEVELTVAGSSTLAEQIRQGAPADVFASADPSAMDTLAEAGLQGAAPVDFTSNTLMIAVPAGNPAHVTDLASLGREDLRVVVCAPVVPCGAAALEVQRAAGTSLAPVSEEQSVTDVLNKVSVGEADAGLVYVTDVQRAGEAVEGIAIPEAAEAVNVYPVTTVAGSAHGALGEEFVELVTGETGQQILAAHGFVAP